MNSITWGLKLVLSGRNLQKAGIYSKVERNYIKN